MFQFLYFEIINASFDYWFAVVFMFGLAGKIGGLFINTVKRF